MNSDTHPFESPFAHPEWKEVAIRPNLLIEALRVLAWVFMLGFVVGIVLTLANRDGDYGALIAFSGIGWMVSAIIVIRVRRGMHRRIKIDE